MSDRIDPKQKAPRAGAGAPPWARLARKAPAFSLYPQPGKDKPRRA